MTDIKNQLKAMLSDLKSICSDVCVPSDIPYSDIPGILIATGDMIIELRRVQRLAVELDEKHNDNIKG